MPETNQTKWRGIRPVSPAENIPVDLKAQTGSSIEVKITGNTVPYFQVYPKTQAFHIYSATGTGADSFNAVQDVGYICLTAILMAEGNGAIFQLSTNNIYWTDDITVPADLIRGIDLQFRYWKVKNRTPGSNTTYTIEGKY